MQNKIALTFVNFYYIIVKKIKKTIQLIPAVLSFNLLAINFIDL